MHALLIFLSNKKIQIILKIIVAFLKRVCYNTPAVEHGTICSGVLLRWKTQYSRVPAPQGTIKIE